MVLICFICLVLVSEVAMQRNIPGLNLNFQQHDYNLTLERMEVVRINKEHCNRFEISTFKYNRTTTAVNITVNLKYRVSEIEVIVQSYKFASNEYRTFPVRFEINFCSALMANVGGIATGSCGNITTCSTFKRGATFVSCNWTPDQTKFPPYIPSGRYMTEFQLLYRSTEISCIHAYSKIHRPEV